MSSGVRRRVARSSEPAKAQVEPLEKDKEPASQEPEGRKDHGVMEAGTYWLTRIVFIRSVGLIYCKSLKRGAVQCLIRLDSRYCTLNINSRTAGFFEGCIFHFFLCEILSHS